MNEAVIQDAVDYIRELFSANTDGHDAAHTMRVYRTTLLLARTEPSCDPEAAALAALLHDADDRKLFCTEDQAHAREFLRKSDVDPEKAALILQAIRAVSFSQNQGRRPDTIEGRIVQDADRLDAMGAIGVARTFAYGGKHDRSLDGSIRHFHDKLLRLRDSMNTCAGRRIAEERHRFLEAFLQELDRELDGTEL